MWKRAGCRQTLDALFLLLVRAAIAVSCVDLVGERLRLQERKTQIGGINKKRSGIFARSQMSDRCLAKSGNSKRREQIE